MKQTTDIIRANEDCLACAQWPAATRCVSYLQGACVIEGHTDFQPADLDQIRARFPDHYVTLDGDMITVWPRPQEQP